MMSEKKIVSVAPPTPRRRLFTVARAVSGLVSTSAYLSKVHELGSNANDR
jgi:hypothetical protein